MVLDWIRKMITLMTIIASVIILLKTYFFLKVKMWGQKQMKQTGCECD